MIPRAIKSSLMEKITPGKVVVLYGPRQVGKTTLVKEIISGLNEPCLLVSGEERGVRDWLASRSVATFRQYLGNNRLLIIDEAQKVDAIGLNLKIMVDAFADLRIIATGSSSFELANQVGEPLVGRKWTFTLYPIAQMEFSAMENHGDTMELLPSRLVYGSYPEVAMHQGLADKREILHGIVDNYLYRDLLEFSEIRRSQKIIDILRLIAFQIGQEVSLSELATQLKISVHTVEKYLDLLEKVFVIKRVHGFSRNLRKEIVKNSRFYFLDNGVRNAVINNFNPIEQRNDLGQLWENYLFVERMKLTSYRRIHANIFFWRTYDRKEIDYVEERDGMLHGFEFKWSARQKVKEPKEWRATYPNATYTVVHGENFLDFVLTQ